MKFNGGIVDLENEIMKVQKSTRTLFRRLTPLHNKLRNKFKFYYYWSRNPYSHFIHWLALILYLIPIPIIVLNSLYNSPSPTVADSGTLDFPRWEYVNPLPTASTLSDIYPADPSHIFVAGNTGTISLYDGINWNPMFTGTTTDLNGISGYGLDNIWSVGKSGLILKYNSSVNTWSRQNSNTEAQLNDVFAVSANDVWAVGQSGTILRTTNGGTTWSTIASGITDHLERIYADSIDNVWAVGASRTILHYDGNTWTRQGDSDSSIYLYDINKVDDGKLWAVGSSLSEYYKTAILESTNNGGTWTEVSTFPLVYAINNVAHPLSIVTNGNKDVWLAGNYKNRREGETSYIYWSEFHHTSDGGDTWDTGENEPYKTPEVETMDYTIINTYVSGSSTDTGGAWIIGNNPTTSSVLKQENGMWAEKAQGSSSAAPRLSILNADNVWMASTGNYVKRWGKDTGEEFHTWETKTTPVDVNGFSISAASENIIWIGNDTTLYKSSDKGESWTQLTNGPEENDFPGVAFNSILSIDENHALVYSKYPVCNNEISYTDDGGTTWNDVVVSAIESCFYDFDVSKVTDEVTDNLSIWAAGNRTANGAGIFRSTDGGATWITIPGIEQVMPDSEQYNVKDIEAYDSNIAYMVAELCASQCYTPNYYYKTINAGEGYNWTTIPNSFIQDSNGKMGLKLSLLNSSDYLAVTGDSTSPWANVVDRMGSNTNNLTSSFLSRFNFIEAVSYNDFWVGFGNKLLHYYSPAYPRASKLQVAVPSILDRAGQTFEYGVGISGNPPTVYAGEDVPAEIYAIDWANKVDGGLKYQVDFDTSDPSDVNPARIYLDGGDSSACNDTDRQISTKYCGKGTTTFQFRTAGTQTITARETGGVGLTQKTSTLTVLPSPTVKKTYFKAYPDPAQNPKTGQVSTFIIGAKDLYDNITSPANDLTLRLSTTSGYFSTNTNGPWTSSLNITVPAGSPTIESVTANKTTTFYYYNFNTGQSTLTVEGETGSGIESSAYNLNTDAGTIYSDEARSTIQISPSTQAAGESSTVTVRLSAELPANIANRTISLYLCNEQNQCNDPQIIVTDASGIATASISTTKSGRYRISAKISDVSGDIWLQSQPEFICNPGPVESISLSSTTKSTVAGEKISLTVNLLDKYNNLVTNSTDTIRFSSTDEAASLPGDYKFTNQDSGARIFSDIILKTVKNAQTIKVLDLNTKKEASLDIPVKAAPPSALRSKIYIDSDFNNLIIGNGHPNINVKIMDDYDNPIQGKEVTLNYDSSFGDIDKSKAITAENGIASFAFTARKEGKVEITAFDITDKFTLNDTLTLIIRADTIPNQVISVVSNISNNLQNSDTAKTLAKITAPLVTAVTGLGILPIITNLLSAIPQAAHFITYSISLGLEAIGIRRKRRNWGRVYDSTTGKNIDSALVRLYSSKDMRLAATIITDPKGEYSFQPEPGEYVVSVSKHGYIFPTNIFAKYGIKTAEKKNTRVFKHYVGQSITITSERNMLNVEVPIDPVEANASLALRIKIFVTDIFDMFINGLSYIFVPALSIGFIMAAFTQMVLPSTRNFIIFLVYTSIALLFFVVRVIKGSHYGIVYDAKTKKPVANAAVSIFEREYNTLKETRITDRFGRYNLHVPKGVYYLKVEKDKYSFPSKAVKRTLLRDLRYRNLYFGETLNMKESSYIVKSIPIDEG